MPPMLKLASLASVCLLSGLLVAMIASPTVAAVGPGISFSPVALDHAENVIHAPTFEPKTEAVPPPEPEGVGALAGHTLAAMQDWMPKKMSGKATHLAEIARDIAWVSLERPRFWDGSNGGREAIVLARIAWFEDMFRDYVDDGSCQVWAPICMERGLGCNLEVLTKKVSAEAAMLMSLGTCDGGLAVGIHQVHYECGAVRLFADGGWQNACSPPRDKVMATITKSDGLSTPNMSDEDRQAHRRQSVRVAHAMARQSIRVGAGLRNYVGGEGPERAAMASMRLDSALAYYAKHPYHS